MQYLLEEKSKNTQKYLLKSNLALFFIMEAVNSLEVDINDIQRGKAI